MLIYFRLYQDKQREEPYERFRIDKATYVPLVGDVYKEQSEDGEASEISWIVMSRKFSVNPYGHLHYVLELEPL